MKIVEAPTKSNSVKREECLIPTLPETWENDNSADKGGSFKQI